MPYEHKSAPMLTRAQFLRRLFLHALAGACLVLASLGIGMLGYAYFEGLGWLDAFLNSAMLLGGMGPIYDEFKTDGGKLFAGFYALYAGLIFLVAVAIALAPVVHRIMHRLHLDESDE
jgi:hypothetical protein